MYHGTPARMLHWGAVAAVLAVFYTAYYNQIFTESEFLAVGLHRQIGLIILAMTAVRFLWRVQYQMPMPANPLPKLMHAVSNATQSLLYVCMLIQPLIGWLYTNAKGHQVLFLGLFPLPSFMPYNLPFASVALNWHATLAAIFAGLIVLHVAGALYHHFVRRDGLLPARRFPRFEFQGVCEVVLADSGAPMSCRLADISAGGARLADSAGWVHGQRGALQIEGLNFNPTFLVVAADPQQARVGFTLDPSGQVLFEKALAEFVASDPRITRMISASALRRRADR
jgi:cytochrome b561